MDVDRFVEKNACYFERILKLGKYSQKSYLAFFDLPRELVIEMVGMYEHVEYLKKRFDWVVTEMDNLDDMIGDAHDEFINSLEPGEHPGWHSFELWESNERIEWLFEVYKTVAQENSLYRVGFFKRTLDVGPVPMDMPAEHRRFFECLAHNLELKLNIREN